MRVSCFLKKTAEVFELTFDKHPPMTSQTLLYKLIFTVTQNYLDAACNILIANILVQPKNV